MTETDIAGVREGEKDYKDEEREKRKGESERTRERRARDQWRER